MYVRELIRYVGLQPYTDPKIEFTIRVWDLHRRDPTWQKNMLGYEFFNEHGNVLFEGEDFACSPMDAVDSDAVVRDMLGFFLNAETWDATENDELRLTFWDNHGDVLVGFTDDEDPWPFVEYEVDDAR